jgi:hypothetical protein
MDRLVKAFFNENLVPKDCQKCAVGNIVGSSIWGQIFSTDDGKQFFFEKGVDTPPHVYTRAENLIKSTGYSVEEMARIEYAFEVNTNYHKLHLREKKITRDEYIQDQFNGLCAVVDVLCAMENIENSQYYKEVLREKPEVV